MTFQSLLNDVVIEFSDHLPEIEPVLFEQPGLKANEKQIWIHINDVGDFYAENGNKILINPCSPLREKSIRLYINGSILGALLQQRGLLALHGSSFALKNSGVVICAESGFGKSTLALEMSRTYHCELLTDDITPIDNGNILPIGEQLKLTQNSLKHFGESIQDLEEVEEDYDKYYLPYSSKKTATPVKIIFIGKHAESIEFQEIYGVDKLKELYRNQYWEFLNDLGEDSRKNIFNEITQVIDQVRLFFFYKPKNSDIHSAGQALFNFLEGL